MYLTSCNFKKNDPEKRVNQQELDSTQKVIVNFKEQKVPKYNPNSKKIKIQFSDFSISFDSIEVWDEDNKLRQVQKDTATVYLELGESIENITIKIIQNKFDKVKIYQRHENSITIMDEGPHCDLINWKHYYSDWKLLKSDDDIFITDSYSESDGAKFIPISTKELIEAVKIHCGKKWSEYVKNVETLYDYPSGVGMSRIFFKIVLENTKTKEKQKKTISFEIPMGC